MPTRVRRLALALALALAALCGAAAGAALLGDDPVALLVPSAQPDLLGPITEQGRTGWACAPERAATAKHAADAGLPDR